MITQSGFKTPILIIAFNRPHFVNEQLAILKHVKPMTLYVSIDGPRNQSDKLLIEETKFLLKTEITWECNLHLKNLNHNTGCKNAVTSAISWFFDHEEAGIILEDDIRPNNSFFLFCEELLLKYKKNPEILLISGDNFFPRIDIHADYAFIDHVQIWGWATWRDRWHAHLNSVQQVVNEASILNPALYTGEQFKLIEDTMSGKIDTWDYLLMMTLKLNHQLTIIPRTHLVSNVGLRGNSTHTKFPLLQFQIKQRELSFPLLHPKVISVNIEQSKRLNNLYSKPGMIWELLKYFFGN